MNSAETKHEPHAQMVELVSEAICTALLLLSGKWFVGLMQLGLLAYMSRLYANRKLFVDTTDAFRQLPEQKKQRFILLGVHLTLFVIVIYRWEGLWRAFMHRPTSHSRALLEYAASMAWSPAGTSYHVPQLSCVKRF
jgi:hypothetical protein